MSPRRPRHTRWDGEAGAELVEMAMTLPLILLVLLAMVDFGLLFQKYEIINNAAREGVRFAASETNATDAQIQTRVMDYVTASGLPTAAGNPDVVITPTTLTAVGGTWQAKQVDVFYFHDHTFLAPFASWFGGNFTSVTLNGQSTMRNIVAGSGLP